MLRGMWEAGRTVSAGQSSLTHSVSHSLTHSGHVITPVNHARKPTHHQNGPPQRRGTASRAQLPGSERGLGLQRAFSGFRMLSNFLKVFKLLFRSFRGLGVQGAELGV